MSLNRSPKHREVMLRYSRDQRARLTKSETFLWQELRGHRLGGWKFRRQWPILNDLRGVGTFAVADFYCASAKLIIEVDGSVHKAQRQEDEARDEALSRRGYSIIRISTSDVEQHLDQVLRYIHEEVCQRVAIRTPKKQPPPSPALGEGG